ncbi:MAG: type II toxin-antitoxin system VapC family toxin [Candidatus Korobacteraceae bacterium]
MSIYADSSLFVSLYLPDRHFTQAQRLEAQHARVWLTPLHRAELANSVAQQLFMKKISAEQAQKILREFQGDREARFWMEVPLADTVFDRCMQLTQQYASRVALRTLDTLHVAIALELGAERFWTFDERQAKLARAAGLKV